MKDIQVADEIEVDENLVSGTILEIRRISI